MFTKLSIASVNHQLRKFIYIIPLCLFILFAIYNSTKKPAEDYAGYYFGSKYFLEGDFTIQNIYETYAFNQKIYNVGYKDIFVSYTPFPPATSLFFIPFTFFDLYTSKLIFNCLSAILFIFSLFRITTKLNVPGWLLLLVPIIFYIPIRNNFYFGQFYLILFFLLIEGLIFYTQKKYLYAALFWAPAVVLKIFPLICLLFLFFKKEWKMLLFLSTTALTILLLSIFLNGFSIWKVYIFEILPRVNNGELNDAFTTTFQSMFMLLKNLFVKDDIFNPNPLFNNNGIFALSYLIFKALVLSGCALITLKNKANNLQQLGIWVMGSLLISPNGSTYSLVLLLIPFLSFTTPQKGIAQYWLFIILFAALCSVPANLFSSQLLLFHFPRLYLMVLIFLVILFKAKLHFEYKPLLLFAAIFLLQALPVALHTETDSSSYLLTSNKYSIIYNYELKDNKITFNYFNDTKGEKTDTASITTTADNSKQVQVQNNQVFYEGKQLTFNKDRKMKATVLADGRVLYLSDQGRGIGFYTFRTIQSRNER